jgi:hypothetical protein
MIFTAKDSLCSILLISAYAVKSFAASLARDAGTLSGRASAPQNEKSTAQEGLLAQTMYEGNEQARWRKA